MLLEYNNSRYKLLAEKLYLRCQEIQIENERNVLRVTKIKKLIRRRFKDVELLKHRLDRYNDNWRSLPMVAPHPKRKIEQKRGPKPKPKDVNEQLTDKKARKNRARKNSAQPTIHGQPITETASEQPSRANLPG